MAVYFVTGKLGNGKTLVAVQRLVDKVKAGRPIASNIDLNILKFLPNDNKTIRYIRIPDKPTVYDLECIGNANTTYDESNNGLLVLDECGTWFNSRTWSDKSRKPVNDWFLHARKLGWDIIFVVQDVSIVDKQAQLALAENVAFCRRLDNLHIPIIGSIYKFYTGYKLTLPKVHIAKVHYGTSQQDPLTDRWVYRGTDAYDWYDTKQCFSDSYPHGAYSVLTPWHIRGRYLKPRGADYLMRITKIVWRKYSRPAIAACALLLGSAIGYLGKPQERIEQVVQSLPTPKKTHNIDRYAELKYTGHYSINKTTFFNFEHPELGRIRSDSPVFKNVMIQPVSSCALELTFGQESIYVTCKDDEPEETNELEFFVDDQTEETQQLANQKSPNYPEGFVPVNL